MVSSGMLRRVALGFLQESYGVTFQKTPFLFMDVFVGKSSIYKKVKLFM
jgi:hypothetical protein